MKTPTVEGLAEALKSDPCSAGHVGSPVRAWGLLHGLTPEEATDAERIFRCALAVHRVLMVKALESLRRGQKTPKELVRQAAEDRAALCDEAATLLSQALVSRRAQVAAAPGGAGR